MIFQLEAKRRGKKVGEILSLERSAIRAMLNFHSLTFTRSKKVFSKALLSTFSCGFSCLFKTIALILLLFWCHL